MKMLFLILVVLKADAPIFVSPTSACLTFFCRTNFKINFPVPHFVIHCSENVLTLQPAEEILRTLHDNAEATQLFKKGDIKVRIQSFKIFTVGNTKSDFPHMFGNIMQGRTTEQKAHLSKAIITKLKAVFPQVPVVSMNVIEFEKETYFNRNT